MLYELAIDTLVQLHETAASENLPEDIPPYDMDHLMAEVMLFVDWFFAGGQRPGRRPSCAGRL